MTGVMNAMGQDGDYTHKQMPIKNRVNGLDVSTYNFMSKIVRAEKHQGGNQNAER